MRRAAVGLILFPLLLSGCAGPANLQSAEAPAPLESSAPGHVAGLVRSSLGLALAGVELTLEPTGTSTLTDDAGRFAFSSVESGEYSLVAVKLGHRSHTHHLRVAPASTVDVEIVLAILDEPAPSRIETYAMKGFVQCSANAVVAVNPCDTAMGATQDHAGILLDVDRELKEIRFELVWTPSTPVTGQELSLDVCEPDGELRCAGAAVDDRFHKTASGSSPVSLSTRSDEWPAGLERLEFWVGSGRLSPYPTVAQPFTTYVTLCFVESCPADFTAIP